MSFYHENRDIIKRNLLAAIEGIYENLGATDVTVNIWSIGYLADSLRSAQVDDRFPHIDGFADASVYKKAAYLFTQFCNYKPITGIAGIENLNEEVWKSNGDWKNVYMAYLLVKESLRNVSYTNRLGETIELKEIGVSPHTMADIVEAFSDDVPADKFKLATLLFEQICYKNNPDAQYKPLL